MEYTKDVIFNVQYGKDVQVVRLRNRKWRKRIGEIYKENKFIITTLTLTIILVTIDLFMVSHFINLLVTL